MKEIKLCFCLLILTVGLSSKKQSMAQQEAEAYSGVTESRLMFQDNCAVCHGENLEGIGRVRDVEMGVDGSIYLLFEHGGGGKVVKLVPNNQAEE